MKAIASVPIFEDYLNSINQEYEQEQQLKFEDYGKD